MARRTAARVLVDVERGRGTARDLLDAALGARPLADPRDRDLARELVYGVLRRRSTLDRLLAVRSRRRFGGLDDDVRAVLRLGAYQLLVLDRVPDHAAVDEAVAAVKRARGPAAGGFVNAVLRSLADEIEGRAPELSAEEDPRRTLPDGNGGVVRLRTERFPDPGGDAAENLALRWSHPRWLVARWLERFGADDTRRILDAGIARPATWLQPAAGREDELRAALTAAGVVFADDPDGSGALRLAGAGAVDALPGFAEGWFRVQDPAAAHALALLDAGAGHRVLELGCGHGGKTRALAAAVGPDGSVTAVDVHAGRLDRLRAALARDGTADRVRIVEGDATAAGVLDDGPFDRVLVDAPCSNTGVLARRVEARWRVRAHDLEMLAAKGRRLLEAGLDRLAPDGRAVHSVCSLEPEEGPDTVARALRGRDDLAVLRADTLLPVAGLRDGGWNAVIG